MADDDEQICRNAAEILGELNLRVQYDTTGEKAVRTILRAAEAGDPFRLIIVDWKLPDVNGVDMARRIRKKLGAEAPLIVLSAYDWTEIENEAREAGVTAFLSKPIYRSRISSLLSGLSGDKQQIRQVFSDEKPDYTGKRLLLVEDNEINREIARELIGETGIQIDEACDGEEAVRMVSESKERYYDMILMDIQMPKMDGYEATKAIRSLDRHDIAALPIIAMTANAFEEDVRAALRAGMNEHFAKPINIMRFEQMMHKYLTGTPETAERRDGQ